VVRARIREHHNGAGRIVACVATRVAAREMFGVARDRFAITIDDLREIVGDLITRGLH
jgi:hypothetical protein